LPAIFFNELQKDIRMKRVIPGLLAALVLPACLASAQDVNFPNKPIHLIVGYAPGGGTDIVARLLGAKVGEDTGQAVVVENRPGGSGVLAAREVAKAKPDGYTLMMGVVSLMTIEPNLEKDFPLDTVKDFAPVTLTASVPHIIVVNPSLPIHSIGELIAYAKSHPGELKFPSAGNGTTPHIAGELFKHMANVKLVHVPYKSSGQSIPDLVAGRVNVGFDTYPAAAPLVRAGKVRAIAVTSTKRLAEFPDVPTVAEAGLPGYQFATWYGIFAPAATPPAVVDKLHAEFQKAMQAPDVHEKLVKMGADDSATATPADFGKLVRADLARFRKVIKDAGITLE
jgi:tripartite-type tricarboxylate transporter receptor subunit TctC